jgi:lysyl-tRNA synthetase class 2
MKRLLAAEKKSIYQICKSFRQGELGTNHNPEFTMLEWYRVGYDHYGLMDEVEDLVAGVLGLERFTRISYRTLFEKTFHVNPHQLSIDELVQLTTSTVSIDQTQLSFSSDALTRSFCLDLLMSEKIEPVLLDPVFIYDYPACQAALSTLNLTGQGDQVAQRFELYIQGKELANGYFELRNANVLRERFTEDNNYRAIEGLPTIPPDQYLLAAMEHGLPDCSGVALGVDRLLMLLMGLTSIDASMTFPATVA